jgi:hypothetical protein
MLRVRNALLRGCLMGALGVSAAAAAASKLVFEDTIKAGKSSSVSVTATRSAAFRVTLKAPTAVRTRLFLTGASAPRGGALIDTKTSACEGAAGSFICRGAFEALPKGTYKFRLAVSGNGAANVTLTVRW